MSDLVLVPRKPTKEMLEAAWADALAENAEGVWTAMIEAYENSQADVCPRCGSLAKNVRNQIKYTGLGWIPCNFSWHDQTAPTPEKEAGNGGTK